MYGEQKPKINVREFIQEIGQFSSFGNEIYREGNPRELKILVYLNLQKQNNIPYKKQKIGSIKSQSIVI